MANRNYAPLLGSLSRKVVVLAGQINLSAAGAVVSESIVGASVAKTGTGTYTITLDDKYAACLSCNLTFQAATAVNLVPQVSSIDVVTNKTIVFKLLAAAVATDPSAVCVVNVSLLLSNTSVTP